MTPRIAKKAKYERLYANGLMYLAKGEPLLAQKYLNEAVIQLKDYITYLFDDERAEAKEWFLELCGHIKEIGKYYTTVKAQNQTEEEPLEASPGAESFAFAKGEIPCVSFPCLYIGLAIYESMLVMLVVNVCSTAPA